MWDCGYGGEILQGITDSYSNHHCVSYFIADADTYCYTYGDTINYANGDTDTLGQADADSHAVYDSDSITYDNAVSDSVVDTYGFALGDSNDLSNSNPHSPIPNPRIRIG